MQEGVILGPETRIGAQSLVSFGVIIAHESEVGECCFISPGVCINGRIKIEKGAFIGSGAILLTECYGRRMECGGRRLGGHQRCSALFHCFWGARPSHHGAQAGGGSGVKLHHVGVVVGSVEESGKLYAEQWGCAPLGRQCMIPCSG